MTPNQLKKWMATHKPVIVKPRYTVTDLARALKVSRQTVYSYLDGTYPITGEVEEKLKGLEK